MVGVKSDTFPFLILIYTKMYQLRGFTDFVALNICNDDVSSHLIDHHLSRDSVSDVYRNSKGKFVSEMENMTVFSAYRSVYSGKVLASFENHQDMGNTCC